MPIVGFNFTNINVEKKDVSAPSIQVGYNVAFDDIKKKELHLGKNKQEGLEINFEFKVSYKPVVGSLSLKGRMLYLGDAKEINDALDAFKKTKKVPVGIVEKTMNNVLEKSIVQAIILCKELGLPSPIPMPSLKKKAEAPAKAKKTGEKAS